MKLKDHSIVSIGGDIIVIGGSDDEIIIIEETPTYNVAREGIVINNQVCVFWIEILFGFIYFEKIFLYRNLSK